VQFWHTWRLRGTADSVVRSQPGRGKGTAEAATAYAQAQIQEAQTGFSVNRPGNFEIEAQQATVRQLEAELVLAQSDLRRSESLRGGSNLPAVAGSASARHNNWEQLNNAKASLIQLETALKTNVGNAQAQLRSQANLP